MNNEYFIARIAALENELQKKKNELEEAYDFMRKIANELEIEIEKL